MDRKQLILIAILASAAILGGIVMGKVEGLTVLFSHKFPLTPGGI
jgi:hypothetical protein